MASDYLTPTDIASLLKISKAQVLRLIANEEFPFTQYHRRIIVRLEDLISYLLKFFPGSSTADSGMHVASDKSPPGLEFDNDQFPIPARKLPYQVKPFADQCRQT